MTTTTRSLASARLEIASRDAISLGRPPTATRPSTHRRRAYVSSVQFIVYKYIGCTYKPRFNDSYPTRHRPRVRGPHRQRSAWSGNHTSAVWNRSRLLYSLAWL